MRPGAHGNLICSALQLAQRYKMLLKASKGEDIDGHGVEGIAIKEDDAKKKAVFEFGVLRCTILERRRALWTAFSTAKLITLSDRVRAEHFTRKRLP